MRKLKSFLGSWVLMILLTGCMWTTVDGGVVTFSLPDLDGNIVSHTDERFKGKVVVVDLWGTWCPPCREQMPELARFYEQYKDQGLEVVGIDFEMYSLGDEEKRREGIKNYVRGRGVTYTILVGGEVADLETVLPSIRGFKGFPTTFFIGRDGQVRKTTLGFTRFEAPRYETIIKDLLAEGAAPPGNDGPSS